jgi:4-amino-4-deoxy-L-arabinose transferase-like glycosyltransferase
LNQPTATNINSKKLLIAILALAVVLRVIAAFYLGNTVEPLAGTYDQVSYHTLASRLLGGFGFTFDTFWWPATFPGTQTAHWSYLYTFYLTAIYALFGPSALLARIIQAVIVGILQPYLAYRLGKTLFGETVGLVSAAITAIYVYFIYYSAALMTEPFYICAILASLLVAIRLGQQKSGQQPSPKSEIRTWILLGLFLGIAILLRQLFLLIAPFVLGWVLYARWRTHQPLGFGGVLISGAVIAAMILPFTVFNATRFDRFVLLNTNAGFAFFWGNHPIHGTNFYAIIPREVGNYLELIPREYLEERMSEAALDQVLLREGIQFVLDEPVRYVLLSLNRAKDYFVFWPSANSDLISNLARLLSFTLFFPFMIYGIVLALTNRHMGEKISLHSPVTLLLGYCLVYTVMHLMTWTLIRYRLPVDAILIVFAGLAITDLANRIPIVRRITRTLTTT